MKDIKKVNTILQDTVDQWIKAIKVADAYEEVISERIGYVIKTVFNTFGKKISTWYYEDAPEGGMGSLQKAFNSGERDGSIRVVVEKDAPYGERHSFGDMDALLEGDIEWDFSYGEFPERWLFEDFEQELIDGKKKFEEKEAARKLKAKEAKSKQTKEDKKLADQVKSKLSKKELAALRRVL